MRLAVARVAFPWLPQVGELGIPRDHVMIVLHEVPRENWGIRGGQAACDVDLGFKVGV
jgi:hypothetical protein